MTCIRAFATFDSSVDPKELIVDAALRRRLSRLVKMGVCTALSCLRKANVDTPDAIISATGYGFLADSEKFLVGTLDGTAQPTPFIQSTFNTIGSTLAVLTHATGYNMTYVHAMGSVASALADALLLLSEGSVRNVLVVAADELTPTLSAILNRFAGRAAAHVAEGANAFLLTADDVVGCLHIASWQLVDKVHTDPSDTRYPTAAAERLYTACLDNTVGTFQTGNLSLTLSK